MENKRNHIFLHILLICVLGIVVKAHRHNDNDIRAKIQSTSIMYGATVRIKAVAFSYYLHSHLVNYPLGSGQQSVTGFPVDNDYNSLWTIKQPHNEQVKTYSDSVKCGDTIRLEHALTKKNLHSEEIFQSMVTKGQEVSCFGNGGYGNDNDNWMIQCLKKEEGTALMGKDAFQLVHQMTDQKLKMSKYYEYSYVNWENCPFQGQLQVSATNKSTKETEFTVVGGVFFREAEQEKEQNAEKQNQEL